VFAITAQGFYYHGTLRWTEKHAVFYPIVLLSCSISLLFLKTPNANPLDMKQIENRRKTGWTDPRSRSRAVFSFPYHEILKKSGQIKFRCAGKALAEEKPTRWQRKTILNF